MQERDRESWGIFKLSGSLAHVCVPGSASASGGWVGWGSVANAAVAQEQQMVCGMWFSMQERGRPAWPGPLSTPAHQL
jgi:hypothetical protein